MVEEICQQLETFITQCQCSKGQTNLKIIYGTQLEMARWLEAALAQDLGLVPSTAMGAHII